LSLWLLIRPHIFWIVLGGVGLFFFHSWLAEHDARLRAEVGVKDAQTQIDTLKQQIGTRQAQTEKQVQVVVKEVQAAKTPEQQIAEIPKLATQDLKPEALPDAPSAVKVELAPLLSQLEQCKVDAINLGSCQQEVADHLAIEAQQDKQVDLLKHRPGFWARAFSDSKKILLGGAIGVGVAIAVREMNH